MTEVETWADARIADVMRREGPRSLCIGPDKPLGGQGFQRTRDLAWALARHSWHLLGAGFIVSHGPAGLWLYAYHQDSLKTLLTSRRELLLEHDWPTRPMDFVRRTISEMMPPQTPLFDLIADAYGDKLNPGRTNVLPHMSRRELLDALGGFADPSLIYFGEARPWEAWPHNRCARVLEEGVCGAAIVNDECCQSGHLVAR